MVNDRHLPLICFIFLFFIQWNSIKCIHLGTWNCFWLILQHILRILCRFEWRRSLPCFMQSSTYCTSNLSGAISLQIHLFSKDIYLNSYYLKFIPFLVQILFNLLISECSLHVISIPWMLTYTISSICMGIKLLFFVCFHNCGLCYYYFLYTLVFFVDKHACRWKIKNCIALSGVVVYFKAK